MRVLPGTSCTLTLPLSLALRRWVKPLIARGVSPTTRHGVVAELSPDCHRARWLTELLNEILDRAGASAINVGIRSETDYETPFPYPPAVRQKLRHRDRRAGHSFRCPPKRARREWPPEHCRHRGGWQRRQRRCQRG